jgi:hypothetical protein
VEGLFYFSRQRLGPLLHDLAHLGNNIGRLWCRSIKRVVGHEGKLVMVTWPTSCSPIVVCVLWLAMPNVALLVEASSQTPIIVGATLRGASVAPSTLLAVAALCHEPKCMMPGEHLSRDRCKGT